MLKILTGWFQAPVFPEDADKTRSALLLNVILNTFLLILPVLFVNSFVGGHLPSPRREITQIIIVLSWLITMSLRHIMIKGFVTAAGITLVSLSFIGTTLMVFNLGTVRTPVVSFYFLAIVLARLTVGRKAIIWMVAASNIAILALLTAEKNGWLAEPNLTVSLTQGVTFIAVFVVLGVLDLVLHCQWGGLTIRQISQNRSNGYLQDRRIQWKRSNIISQHLFLPTKHCPGAPIY